MQREREIVRSARTGRWISLADAKRRKATSVIERVKVASAEEEVKGETRR